MNLTGQVFQVALYAVRARSSNVQLVEMENGYQVRPRNTGANHDVEVGLFPGTMQANDDADAWASSLEWALQVFPRSEGWICHKVAITPMTKEAVLAAVKCLAEAPESAVGDACEERSLEWPETFDGH